MNTKNTMKTKNTMNTIKTEKEGRGQRLHVPAPESMKSMRGIKTTGSIKTTGRIKTAGLPGGLLSEGFGRSLPAVFLCGFLLSSCMSGGLEPPVAEEAGGSLVRFTVSAVQGPDTRATDRAAGDGSGCNNGGRGSSGAAGVAGAHPGGIPGGVPVADTPASSSGGAYALLSGPGGPASSSGNAYALLSGSGGPDASGVLSCTTEGDLGEVCLIESEEEFGAYAGSGEHGDCWESGTYGGDESVSGSDGKDVGNVGSVENGKDGKDVGSVGSGENGKGGKDVGSIGSGENGKGGKDVGSIGSGENGKGGKDVGSIGSGQDGQNGGSRTLTRAEITTAITGNFSTIGYRSASASGLDGSSPWFHNAGTNPDGTLVTPVYWSESFPHARFYGICPYTADGPGDRIRLSPASHGGTPYVDFEAKPNATAQEDLLTACSGVVHYATPGVHPRTDLTFRHALTGIRFAVGSNLNWNKVIDRVELRNACGRGRYTLSDERDGTGASWNAQDGRGTFALGGGMQGGIDYGTIAVNTARPSGTVILGAAGDNCTFLMVPQPLTGKGVTAHVRFTDGSSITASLSGEWRPGTVKTYRLSNTSSDWEYTLKAFSPAPVAYNATTTGIYTVLSWRRPPVGETQPVPWEVTGYDADGDGTFSMGEQPSWLTGLSMTSGPGSITWQGERGTAALAAGEIVDLLPARNDALKNAAPRGAPGSPWNLSNVAGEATVQNTANSYVISARGWYKIPLVYGNAIKTATPVANLTSSTEAGTKNESAYKTANAGTYILSNFRDHNNVAIDDPWITQSNGGANAPDGAKIIWADGKDLVKDLQVVGAGENAFVQFRVPEQTGTGTDLHGIHNANAVIAVTRNNTVVWSWHLWFAPQSVLQTTACTNRTNYIYHFTNETLGWKDASWFSTTYTSPRRVKVKLEQTFGQASGKKTDTLIITQNNHSSERRGYGTLYQWGRKDALPCTNIIPDGSFTENGGNNMSVQNSIQHPEIFYNHGHSWANSPITGGYSYFNLWSMDNPETINNHTASYNDNPVVKTIYDPCPAGFKMPPGNAFTGFYSYPWEHSPNAPVGSWDHGHYFYNKPTDPDATVYFPASGFRYYDGLLYGVGIVGRYWTGAPGYHPSYSLGMDFNEGGIHYTNFGAWVTRTNGYSVRPVRDIDFGGGHSGGESGGGLGD